MKPGNAGGGKGPQFRVSARRGKAQETGDEPTSSGKCAEASDGIACQSEGRALLSLLCAVRQAVPGGAMREMMERLKLTVNEEKTRLCCVPDTSLDFVGYTFGRCYSAKTGRAYIGTRPSKKSIAKVSRTISELTSRRRLPIDTQVQVVELNRVLTGWGNYFCQGPVSRAYRAINAHVAERL